MILSFAKKEIEILVRAIIQERGKVLVCRKVGKRYYFFPGGHVEFGESVKKVLTRELNKCWTTTSLTINLSEYSGL
jgi:ADP-ribose pyrophosphatase YjhB (NUDIX family)